MGVITLQRILIDDLDPAVVGNVASPVDPSVHLTIGQQARQDYKIMAGSGSNKNLIISQNGIAKKVDLQTFADMILYYHDLQQLNHKNILPDVGNKPGGVPLLDLLTGKVGVDQLPYKVANSRVLQYVEEIGLKPPGEDQDMLIDCTDGSLYLYDINAWRLLTNLKGTNGTNGINGTNGLTPVKGVDYFDGLSGTNGNRILSGSGVPSDISMGTDNDFYLDASNFDLYGPKLGGAWPTTPLHLKGTKGDPGNDGVGIKGDKGDTGASILNGVVAPLVSTGIDGDFYIDKANYIIYGPKLGGVWAAGTSLKANIYVQATQPTDPLENTIWIDTTNL
jgi:hypothetical protein